MWANQHREISTGGDPAVYCLTLGKIGGTGAKTLRNSKRKGFQSRKSVLAGVRKTGRGSIPKIVNWSAVKKRMHVSRNKGRKSRLRGKGRNWGNTKTKGVLEEECLVQSK